MRFQCQMGVTAGRLLLSAPTFEPAVISLTAPLAGSVSGATQTPQILRLLRTLPRILETSGFHASAGPFVPRRWCGVSVFCLLLCERRPSCTEAWVLLRLAWRLTQSGATYVLW